MSGVLAITPTSVLKSSLYALHCSKPGKWEVRGCPEPFYSLVLPNLPLSEQFNISLLAYGKKKKKLPSGCSSYQLAACNTGLLSGRSQDKPLDRASTGHSNCVEILYEVVAVGTKPALPPLPTQSPISTVTPSFPWRVMPRKDTRGTSPFWLFVPTKLLQYKTNQTLAVWILIYKTQWVSMWYLYTAPGILCAKGHGPPAMWGRTRQWLMHRRK